MTSPLEIPTPEAVRAAQAALRQLAPLAVGDATGHTVRVSPEGGGEQPVMLPRQAFELFLEILGQMANGNAVTIVPVHAELTTQQAADLLNVSRPHLVQLLEAGTIPFRRVGSHRRVRAEDLVAYMRAEERRAREALAELTRQGQDLRLGY